MSGRGNSISAGFLRQIRSMINQGVSPTAIRSAVENYLSANPPTAAWGGISGTLSSQSDLSLALSSKAPSSHSHGDTYEAAGAVAAHELVHAPNDAVNLTTVKADSQIADAISKAHQHEEDFTTALKSNYDTAYTHSQAAHATPMSILTVSGDKATGANTTPVTLGISFDYEANKTYVIDIYAMVAPGAATTGCGFLIDVSSAVTYVGTFAVHQLATSGTVSGGGSIGDLGATSQGVSSGMVGTGNNFVAGSALLITGANTGTATFYFRSETTAVTTCKSGSVFRIMKVN